MTSKFLQASPEEQQEIVNLLLLCLFTNTAEAAYIELEAINKRRYFRQQTKQLITQSQRLINKAMNPIREFYNEDAMNTENKLTNLVTDVTTGLLCLSNKDRAKVMEYVTELLNESIDMDNEEALKLEKAS